MSFQITPIFPKKNFTWNPKNGEYTLRILRNNRIEPTLENGKNILEKTKSILGCCVDPKGDPKRNTGLVIGYVQSGKTISFTTLIADAIENGFKMIIVLSGIKNNLNNQTFLRISKDFHL